MQSSKISHLINEAIRTGRVDMFVQSCDKNLMVPVGGAIIATGGDATIMDKVAQNYAGRASIGPTLDVFMTLLSLGRNGYMQLLKQRKAVYTHLVAQLTDMCGRIPGMRVMHTPNNPISIGACLLFLLFTPR